MFFELLLEKRKIYVNRPFINQIMKNKSFFFPFVYFVEFRRRQADNWNILEIVILTFLFLMEKKNCVYNFRLDVVHEHSMFSVCGDISLY